MSDPAPHEVADHLAISRLQSAYADVVNRRAWNELDEQFLPDTPVRIDTVSREAFELAGPRQVGEFISGAIERFGFFDGARVDVERRVQPILVRPDALQVQAHQLLRRELPARHGCLHLRDRRLDQAERHRVFNEIQQIFANNLPAIYFVAPRLYMATSTRVGGLSPSILRPQLLWDVDRITVQGGR